MTPGNSNGKRRSSVSNASGVFEKLKTNVFKAFDDVDMDTFFEASSGGAKHFLKHVEGGANNILRQV